MDLIGTDGDDTLVGSNDNDRLIGKAGNDTLDGGGPFNAAVYDFTASNAPVFFTSTVDVTAASSTQADGLGGTDTLIRIGGEEMYGGSADDRLAGSNGQDFIDGGGGNDVLTGGPGRDSFAFDTAQANVGLDTITDPAPGDAIVLHHFVFSGAPTSGDGSTVTHDERLRRHRCGRGRRPHDPARWPIRRRALRPRHHLRRQLRRGGRFLPAGEPPAPAAAPAHRPGPDLQRHVRGGHVHGRQRQRHHQRRGGQ